MSNDVIQLLPEGTAVHSVELAPGISVDSSMSVAERQAIYAKAFGQPAPEKTGRINFGPMQADGRQAHTSETINTFKQRDASALAADMAAVKWTPAKPAPVVPQSTPEDRAKNPAAFEPPSPVVAKEANQPYMQGLLNIYQDKLSRYDEALKIVKTPAAKSKLEKDVLALKVQFQKEYAYASEGGQQRDYGKTVTPASSTDPIDIAAAAADSEGWAHASKITGPLLHGYTIPADREYLVADLVAGLKLAREGDLTQAQVDKLIKGRFSK